MKHSKRENYINILSAIADASLTLVDAYNGDSVVIPVKHYSFCFESMETYYIRAEKLEQKEREAIHAGVVYRLANDCVGKHFMEVYVDEFTTAKQVADMFATRLAER